MPIRKVYILSLILAVLTATPRSQNTHSPLHSNPLPSYLLFTQATQSASFPLCSKPSFGQRLFGVTHNSLPTVPSYGTEIKNMNGISSKLCLFVHLTDYFSRTLSMLIDLVYTLLLNIVKLVGSFSFVLLSIRIQLQSLQSLVQRVGTEPYPLHIQ